ncbi:MAG: winged helix-turn-helix domain-containing protein [Promethearchaeota archaeon]
MSRNRVVKDNLTKLHHNQKKILEILLDGKQRQNELAKLLKLSGAGLLYHLDKLEELNLILKKTVQKIGNVSINEIMINPNELQHVRMLLKREKKEFTLITGFGKDSDLGVSSRIPAIIKGLLEQEGYNITRVVAFATPDSNIKNAKKLTRLDKVIVKEYQEYRDNNSDLMRNIENLIQEEQQNNDLILDLTPLSKLLTIKLLEYSFKYRIPCVYIGKKPEGDYLIWINYPSMN